MVEKIAVRGGRKEVTCGHCSKKGHDEKNRFLLRKYFRCSKLGHISRFCPENRPPSSYANIYDDTSTNLPPSERMFLKVAIGEERIELLYNTGSMYTMIKKEIYDNLRTKPALLPLEKSGVGATGHKFNIDGVAYLNLKWLKEGGSFYNIEYEPVLEILWTRIMGYISKKDLTRF